MITTKAPSQEKEQEKAKWRGRGQVAEEERYESDSREIGKKISLWLRLLISDAQRLCAAGRGWRSIPPAPAPAPPPAGQPAQPPQDSETTIVRHAEAGQGGEPEAQNPPARWWRPRVGTSLVVFVCGLCP